MCLLVKSRQTLHRSLCACIWSDMCGIRWICSLHGSEVECWQGYGMGNTFLCCTAGAGIVSVPVSLITLPGTTFHPPDFHQLPLHFVNKQTKLENPYLSSSSSWFMRVSFSRLLHAHTHTHRLNWFHPPGSWGWISAAFYTHTHTHLHTHAHCLNWFHP
jgi:hypothetical protein